MACFLVSTPTELVKCRAQVIASRLDPTSSAAAQRAILSESGLREGEFEAAHATLYVHLLGSVQLEHVRPAGAAASAANDWAFAYGLRLILAGLRGELEQCSAT